MAEIQHFSRGLFFIGAPCRMCRLTVDPCACMRVINYIYLAIIAYLFTYLSRHGTLCRYLYIAQGNCLSHEQRTANDFGLQTCAHGQGAVQAPPPWLGCKVS